ncbi:hypothetical protein BKA70DRAFT_251639 [Coprinopsis sp. MPI-PUGE-AT-0042]|nr:hypothetical protein BKA70DRAFT_251639 [Coprinopsis sp. MPI-PUGE-AT-0042]
MVFNGVWAPQPFTGPASCRIYGNPVDPKPPNSNFPPDLGQEYKEEIGWMKKQMGFLLHLAIADDKLSVTDMLLRLGAPTQTAYETAGGLQPLHVAIRCRRNPAFTQLLLQYGANPAAATRNGYDTPAITGNQRPERRADLYPCQGWRTFQRSPGWPRQDSVRYLLHELEGRTTHRSHLSPAHPSHPPISRGRCEYQVVPSIFAFLCSNYRQCAYPLQRVDCMGC